MRANEDYGDRRLGEFRQDRADPPPAAGARRARPAGLHPQARPPPISTPDFDVDRPGKDSHSIAPPAPSKSSCRRAALGARPRIAGRAERRSPKRCWPAWRRWTSCSWEGFKSARHDKIEVRRAAAAGPPLAPGDPTVVAIAADPPGARRRPPGVQPRRYRGARRFHPRALRPWREEGVTRLGDDCFVAGDAPAAARRRAASDRRAYRAGRRKRNRAACRALTASSCRRFAPVAPCRRTGQRGRGRIRGLFRRSGAHWADGAPGGGALGRGSPARRPSAPRRRAAGVHRRGASARRRRRGAGHRVHAGGLRPRGRQCVPAAGDCPRRQPPPRAGEDVAAGALVLEAGRRLRAEDLGLAASVGLVSLPVRVPLAVALFSTGDEVREPGESLPPAPSTTPTGRCFPRCSLASAAWSPISG